MYKDVNNTTDIWCYMEDLALHTGAPTVHWSDNKNCIYVVESKRVTPIVLKIDIPVCFIQETLTMVFLIPTMISIVSYRHKCAPNYVQVQLSVGVLNGLMGSFSTQPVI